MDTIFQLDGIDYLRWTDNDGNTWEARLDEVEWFGKECFECMPEPEDHLGSWGVEFNQDSISIELDEETEAEINEADPQFYSWLRNEEII